MPYTNTHTRISLPFEGRRFSLALSRRNENENLNCKLYSFGLFILKVIFDFKRKYLKICVVYVDGVSMCFQHIGMQTVAKEKGNLIGIAIDLTANF